MGLSTMAGLSLRSVLIRAGTRLPEHEHLVFIARRIKVLRGFSLIHYIAQRFLCF